METCSICRAPYTGWGNNAAPFAGRCCDDCNDRWVIPARIFKMQPDNALLPVLQAFARHGSLMASTAAAARQMRETTRE